MDKMSAVSHALGMHHDAPKKEISEIRIKKSHNGGHVITHKHHSPEHHPDETHTTKGDDELAQHVMKHAGDPNEGEAADPSMQGAAPMTASPSPAGAPPMAGAAAAPTAMA